jgi:hypothetical protein
MADSLVSGAMPVLSAALLEALPSAAADVSSEPQAVMVRARPATAVRTTLRYRRGLVMVVSHVLVRRGVAGVGPGRSVRAAPPAGGRRRAWWGAGVCRHPGVRSR